MRLIPGKTNDYYDCMLAYNSTEGNVYLRNNDIQILGFTRDYTCSNGYRYKLKDISNQYSHFVENELNNFYENYTFRTKKYGQIIISIFKILFAGKLYTCVKFDFGFSGLLDKRKSRYCYDINEVISCCFEFEIEFPDKPKRKSYFSFYSTDNFNKQTIKEAFKIIDVSGYCIENKLVIAAIYRSTKSRTSLEITVDIDCELKNYEFYKVFDTYSAYQELSMFVDGMLAYPGNTTIEIEDKYKISAKGFDEKYGFRTRPKGN